MNQILYWRKRDEKKVSLLVVINFIDHDHDSI